MKNIKNYILESENPKVDEETYVIYEFSLNDLQSDHYLSKCTHETYKDRLIIVRSDMGIRYYMHILKVRELKNCFAEYPFKFTKKQMWIAPDEIQKMDEKDLQEYIKKNSDEIKWEDILLEGNRITIDVKRK